MDTIFETDKRLRISKDISSQLEGIVQMVLLGGSMGFGQNFSVTDKSDIDMVVVCDKNYARVLASRPYFEGNVPQNVLGMFEDGIINLFWVTKAVDSVEVNTFVYETEGYKKFCSFEGGLKGYIPTRPAETQESYGFDGTMFTFKRNVVTCPDGFIYEKPALANGRFWGGPPRGDFLIRSCILYQKDGFFDEMQNRVWKNVVKQMVKEHGRALDLNKINILNTDFTYQRKREKLSPEVIEETMDRTRKELAKR